VSFFIGSGDGIVADNTAWGCRQGVRVYGASNVLVYRNILFRNENSGAYFAAKSVNGLAIRNISFENAKGLRWSSESAGGLALDNDVFDNRERGISLENVTGAVLRGNRLVGNAVSQLQVIESAFTSENNCFAAARGQLVADFTPFGPLDRYATLAEYQAARAQDLHARSGNCGTLPAAVDVHRLHAATSAYPAPVEAPAESWEAWARRWLARVRGR
jgi:parallel beta-helix repeat protein